MPFARLGTVEQRWTTDSRHLTPDWLPGEIIVERYDVYIPYTLSAGTYPLILGYTDMTNGVAELTFTGGAMTLPLAEITVLPAAAEPTPTVPLTLWQLPTPRPLFGVIPVIAF